MFTRITGTIALWTYLGASRFLAGLAAWLIAPRVAGKWEVGGPPSTDGVVGSQARS